MNGIAGWLSFNSDMHQNRNAVQRMTMMSSQGVGTYGTWIRRNIALGCRKFMPEGHQSVKPIVVQNAATAIAVAYSGELHDVPALQAHLRSRGHRFVENSDDEIVLRSYIEWGTQAPKHLNGRFAAAIWDSQENKLIMFRDRLGIDPLYYYQTPDGALFGSVPDSIFESGSVPREVRYDGFRELFGGFPPPGQHFWSGIYEVDPGTVVTVTSRGLIKQNYWKLPSVLHVDNYHESVERIHRQLVTIVEREIQSLTRPCVLLSGGLDSSALVGLASSNNADKQVKTFSVRFADETNLTDDSRFINDVVNINSTDHDYVVVSPRRLADPELRRSTIRARGIPGTWGDSDASLYLLFKAVREKCPEVLTGDVADAVFGEGPWLQEALDRVDKCPWILREHTEKWSKIVRPDIRNDLNLDQFRQELNDLAAREIVHLEGKSSIERKVGIHSYLEITRVARSLLDRVDRMSRAVGLKVRVPYADHHLVEYVYSIPWSLKIFDGREKSLLRSAIRHKVPPSVANRKKAPYPTIRNEEYSREIHEQAKEILADSNSRVFDLVDRAYVEKLVRDCDETAAMVVWGGPIGRVLDLYHWFDIYDPHISLD